MFGRPHNLRGTDEALERARRTQARTHISHIIYVGRSTWSTMGEQVKMIDDANSSGLDISFDIYPFDFGASTINVALPNWYQGLSDAEKRKSWTQLKLWGIITATVKLLGFNFDDIQITWAGENHKDYIGKRVSEIAEASGLSWLKGYLKVIDDSDAAAEVIMYTYMNDHIIDVLSRHPKVTYMTDAWINGRGMENPASFHAFPKFLRLAREGKAESLGPMLRKMTGDAAARFGLKNRGCIKPGYYADLCLFDKNTISEDWVYGTNGENPPIGLPHVMINGEWAVKDGVYLEKSLGKALGWDKD
jgi:N-acyl-D-amino-acid deacylase